MEHFEVFLVALFVAVAGLKVLARWLTVPYPIPLAYQRMMHDTYEAQRSALVQLRNEGEISSEVMRRMERALDLGESRLEV